MSKQFGIQSNKSSSNGGSEDTPPHMTMTPPDLIESEQRLSLIEKHIAETKDDVYFGKYYAPSGDLSQTLNQDLNESYVQRAYRKEQLTEQSNFSLFMTILAYIRKDIKKKARSFRIGVFTVFLVVSFITALKSLIDVAPIAFLKVAQDQAGAIDVKMVSDIDKQIQDGDLNYYRLDHLSNWNRTNTSALEPGKDHFELFGFDMLVFDAFKDKLDPLSEKDVWKGFSPRWTIPAKLRSNQLTTSIILIIMDTAREVQYGIGPYFSKTILGLSEMISSEQALRYLKTSPGEKAEIYMDLPDMLSLSKFSHLPKRNFFSQEPINEEINEILSLLFEDREHLKRTIQKILGPVLQGEHILLEPLENMPGFIKLDQMIHKVYEGYKEMQKYGNGTEISHDFKIVESFSQPEGKFGDQLGNAVVIDCKYIDDYYSQSIQTLYESLPPVLGFTPKADDDIWCNYALQVIGVLDDQVNTYTLGKHNMKHQLSVAGDELIDALTYDANITVTTPLEGQLKTVSMITVFMNTIMATIVAFLAILCAQLIYSLMLSDVEEKTYEFGMLRALGFNTNNLMATIILQAFTFAIPGLISGLVVAAVMNLGMRNVLYKLTNNTSDFYLSSPSVLIGFSIGFFLPLISNIIPIQKALGKNLRASLDPYHRSAGELLVQIKSLEKFGLSLNQLLMAFMLVILGVMTYYVAPAAFLLGDYEVFFGILNSLLLMMILGLTFISILLLPKIMRFWVNVFLFIIYKDIKLKQIVMKNLKSHKKRNVKTAIMFAICLSFLIFAGSTFALIGNLIESTLETQLGADFYCVSIDRTGLSSFIDDGAISMFLDEQNSTNGDILGYTFTSHGLGDVLNKINPKVQKDAERVTFSDFAGYRDYKTTINAIRKNYLEVVDLDYYLPAQVEQDIKSALPELDNGELNIVESLYSTQGISPSIDGTKDPHKIAKVNFPDSNSSSIKNLTEEIRVIVPEGMRDPLSLDTDREARLCIGNHNECNFAYKVKIRAMVTKMPGFLQFTSYQSAQFMSQQLISEDQYAEILEDYFQTNPIAKENLDELTKGYNLTNNIPKYKMFVKLHPDISDDRRDFIANGIRATFKTDATILLDKQVAFKAVEKSLVLFEIFVGLVGTIALVLAFFLLLISTTQNIKENVWEYGCLRAMGFNKAQGIRVFMYEQYSLILSSLILGCFVGLVLSSVVTAQFYLFLEYPFKFILPEGLLWTMVVMSLITTFFATLIPIREVNKSQIATIIKGNA